MAVGEEEDVLDAGAFGGDGFDGLARLLEAGGDGGAAAVADEADGLRGLLGTGVGGDGDGPGGVVSKAMTPTRSCGARALTARTADSLASSCLVRGEPGTGSFIEPERSRTITSMPAGRTRRLGMAQSTGGLLEVGSDPPAGPEPVGAADHDQAAAEVVDVGGEVLLLDSSRPPEPRGTLARMTAS